MLYQSGRKYAGGPAVEIEGLRTGGSYFKLVARFLLHGEVHRSIRFDLNRRSHGNRAHFLRGQPVRFHVKDAGLARLPDCRDFVIGIQAGSAK